jgi:hypothetical protein
MSFMAAAFHVAPAVAGKPDSQNDRFCALTRDTEIAGQPRQIEPTAPG